MVRAKNERENDLAGKNDARDVFDHLRNELELFQSKLNNQQELGIRLANFGLAAQINIREISFKNPNLIEFTGINESGNLTKLIQHIGQLNFALIAVDPIDDLEPYRVGF